MIIPIDGVNLPAVLAELELAMIEQALHRSHGNRARAAKILGLVRPTLVAKMKKLGLMHVDYGQVLNVQHDIKK